LCLANARASVPWQPVIEKILTHLGLQADCGRMSAPARGHAPQEGLALASASAARRARRRRVRQPVGRSCKRPDCRVPSQSGGPDAGDAEIGCVWAWQSRGLRPRRPGKPEGKRYERHPLGLRSVFNGLVPRVTTTWVRVRELAGACSGEEKGRLKSLSSTRMPGGVARAPPMMEAPYADCAGIGGTPAGENPVVLRSPRTTRRTSARARPIVWRQRRAKLPRETNPIEGGAEQGERA